MFFDNIHKELKPIIIIALIVFLFWWFSTYTESFYNNPNIYLETVPNNNAFGNYYRAGYEDNKDLGWKPSLTWEYLRPEANECPECFTYKAPIEIRDN
jgi:hypothetical protein